jgi:hypothetical protein
MTDFGRNGAVFGEIFYIFARRLLYLMVNVHSVLYNNGLALLCVFTVSVANKS